jgi:hypothetical protein
MGAWIASFRTDEPAKRHCDFNTDFKICALRKTTEREEGGLGKGTATSTRQETKRAEDRHKNNNSQGES